MRPPSDTYNQKRIYHRRTKSYGSGKTNYHNIIQTFLFQREGQVDICIFKVKSKVWDGITN